MFWPWVVLGLLLLLLLLLLFLAMVGLMSVGVVRFVIDVVVVTAGGCHGGGD